MPTRQNIIPKNCTLFILVIFTLSVSSAFGEIGYDRARYSFETVNTQRRVDTLPVWTSNICWHESLLFVQKNDKGLPQADLLFVPTKILIMQNSRRNMTYELGRDYIIQTKSRRVVLPRGSRIPFKKESELYPPKGSLNSYRHKVGDPNTHLLFVKGHYFHDLQAEISYEHAGKWTGYTPAFAGKILPKTLKKLRARKQIKIHLTGDSISNGWNSSRLLDVPPYQPNYGNLVAMELARHYRGVNITFENSAIDGIRSDTGIVIANEIINGKQPDLIILAFGMNAIHRKNTDEYKTNLAKVMQVFRRRNPDVEFILVSSMLANPEWSINPIGLFPVYRDVLKSLTGPGVALADVTALWSDVTKRKKFLDLTGNGLNHPNDFGQGLYAQVILTLLVEGY